MLTRIFTTKWSMPSINKEVFSLKEGENHGFFNWFLKGPLLIISQADLWHVTDPPIRKIYSDNKTAKIAGIKWTSSVLL